MKLNHVALTVSNREASAQFYETWFGPFARVHEDDHLLILREVEGGLLAMSEGAPPVKQPRITHFGFELNSVDEVIAMREAFSQAGVREAEWQEKGPTRVQVFDPDGYRVEVFAF